MRKDRFTDEALKAAYALAELKYSENPEDQLAFAEAFAEAFSEAFSEAFAEAYDFARCQRPDGSFYGTSGQCRKGKPAGEKAEEPKKAKRASGPRTAGPPPDQKAKEMATVKAAREKMGAPKNYDPEPWKKWESGQKKPRDLATVTEEFKRVDKAFDKLNAKETKAPYSKEWWALEQKRADLFYEKKAAQKEARRAKKAGRG